MVEVEVCLLVLRLYIVARTCSPLILGGLDDGLGEAWTRITQGDKVQILCQTKGDLRPQTVTYPQGIALGEGEERRLAITERLDEGLTAYL